MIEQLIQVLRQKKWKIATVESVTGGLIASTLVSIPHASDVFSEGFITYTSEAKVKILGLNQAWLLSYDVVSEKIASEMAKALKKKTYANIVVSTTGYAGPNSGNKNIPVGTICYSIGIENQWVTETRVFQGSRNEIREAACQHILKRIYEMVKE